MSRGEGHELGNRAEPKVSQVVVGASRARDAPRPRAASGTDSPCAGQCPAPPVTGTGGIALTGHGGGGAGPAREGHPQDRALTHGPLLPSLQSAASPHKQGILHHVPARSTACTGLILVPEWIAHPSQHSWGGFNRGCPLTCPRSRGAELLSPTPAPSQRPAYYSRTWQNN